MRCEILETVHQGHRTPEPQEPDTALIPSFPNIFLSVSTGEFLSAFIIEVRGKANSLSESNDPILSVMKERDAGHNIQQTAWRSGYREQL